MPGQPSVDGRRVRVVDAVMHRTHDRALVHVPGKYGKCSENCTPGTLVAIGWNSPRISTGAAGFMSHVSRWLGPPFRKITMR